MLRPRTSQRPFNLVTNCNAPVFERRTENFSALQSGYAHATELFSGGRSLQRNHKGSEGMWKGNTVDPPKALFKTNWLAPSKGQAAASKSCEAQFAQMNAAGDLGINPYEAGFSCMARRSTPGGEAVVTSVCRFSPHFSCARNAIRINGAGLYVVPGRNSTWLCPSLERARNRAFDLTR